MSDGEGVEFVGVAAVCVEQRSEWTRSIDGCVAEYRSWCIVSDVCQNVKCSKQSSIIDGVVDNFAEWVAVVGP